MREIGGLVGDGFCQIIPPVEAVWMAGLAGIMKTKIPPNDLLGLMGDVPGGVSKYFQPSRAETVEFRREYGLQAAEWRGQRDEWLRRLHEAMSPEDGANVRGGVQGVLDESERWWAELHQV
jgi:hypothetical protein